MAANFFTLYAIKINGSSPFPTVIDQILSQNIDPGLTEMLESGDSSLDNGHVSASNQAPTIRFSTSAIAKALDATGVGGLVIAAEETATSVDLYFRKRVLGSGFASGSEHLKMTVNLGVLVPVTVSGTHPDRAEIEYMLHVLYDGSNDPILLDKEQTLPDLSPAISNIHTIGPWWVNNTKLIGMRSLTVNFGLNVATKASDGDVWPTSGYIESRGASMTGQTTDLEILDRTDGVGILGTVQTGGEFAIRAFLRKKVKGGQVLIDATAEHIRFSVAVSRVSPQEFGGEHQGDATAGLLVTPTAPVGNDPIVYTKGVAVA